MTETLIDAALRRHPALEGKVKLTTSWNLENVAAALATADMFVGFRMPKELIRDASPRLKSIHVIGAGVEHLHPTEWISPGIVVTNNRGVHRQKAAESILLFALMLNSNIPGLATAQRNANWNPLFATSIKGKTALIIGVGEVGSAGANELRKLGLRVVGIRRSGTPHPSCDETYGPSALHALLPQADFVFLTTPLTKETRTLIGKAEFALMKPGAGFANFCRAKVCDYNALGDCLHSGKISGAILDVFDPEPLPADSWLWTVPNLFITPHCLSDDAEQYIPMTLDLVFENAKRLLNFQPMKNIVDLQREY
ncbi:D-2-hydroxyacid dehydrogenase [Bradyrhizobium niftali]|nr:D-2-hydroxyacid dehydrogenase [Bradyrhizobium niftali]